MPVKNTGKEGTMRSRLMDFLACPECRSNLRLTVFEEDGDEVVAGRLDCGGCKHDYPVIGGVPRLLPDTLSGAIRKYHPEYFARYGQRQANSKAAGVEARTLEFFTMQRPELHDAQTDPARIRAVEHSLDVRIPQGRGLGGQVGLDAGCGEGRYVHVLTRYGAEVVGMDLGNSVDYAYAWNRGNANAHIVQGSIYQPPFRPGVFDFFLSIGVLHHLPDPGAGFQALVSVVRAGGTAYIWVYGMEGMSLVYRLSHLVPLRRYTSRLSPRLTRAIAVPVATALHLLVFEPVRLLEKTPAASMVHPQLHELAALPFNVKVAEVHDRLGAPVTHFPTAAEVQGWLDVSGFVDTVVERTEGGRGWTAHGTLPLTIHEPAAQVRQ